MSDSSRALTIRFASDTGPAKQAIESLAKNVIVSMAAIGASGGVASAGLNKLGGSAPGIANVVSNIIKLVEAYKLVTLGVAAFGVAAAAASEQVEKLQKIAEGARAGGVSGEFFQVWTGQATDLHLKVEDLTSALQHFKEQLRATPDDVSNFEKVSSRLFTGERDSKGDISKGPIFNQGAPALGRQFFGADTAEKQIRAVIAAMQELIKQGDLVSAQWVGGQMFGNKVGDAEVEALKKGRDILGEQMDRARELGTIFDEGMVKKADEFHGRLEQARQDMSDGMMPIMKDLAALGLNLNENWVRFEELVGKAVLKVGELYTAMKNLPNLLQSANVSINSATRQGAQILSALPGTTPEEQKIFQDRAARLAANPAASPNLSARLDRARPGKDADDRRLVTADDVPGVLVSGAPLPPRKPDLLSPTKEPKASSPDTDTTTALERQITSLEKAAALAKVEAETWGKSNQEKERATALLKAQEAAQQDVKDELRDSATLTADETAKIVAAADATVKWKDNVKKLQEAQEAANERMQAFADVGFSAFEGIVTGSKSASDALRDMAKSLADMVLKAALLGQGPLASLFGAKGADGAVGGLFGQLLKSALGASSPANGGYHPPDASYVYPSGAAHSFAGGGVMTSRGPVPLRRYASGGIANSPQLALFGEGGGNEAYVPLPDGRSIPVSLRNPQLPSIQAAPPTRAPLSVAVHNYHSDAQVETRQNSGGGIDVIVNSLSARLLDQAARGQGAGRALTRIADGSHLRG